MEINFVILGRLGNAIYRYMAAAIVCIKCKGNYVINKVQYKNLTDNDFYNIFVKNENVELTSVNMCGYYQHDNIYKIYKDLIKEFIRNNSSHYVLTDGITAGDLNHQKFYMIDILDTPVTFNKKYEIVLHIRLEDFVTYNLYIKKERIVELLKKIKTNGTICVVCNKPNTNFEFDYINYICDYFKNNNINHVIESNDVLTDFYIMKEAKILICSKSTLSWCAAFFSDNIETCYFPDYNLEQPDIMTCKSPIDNTILY